MSLNLYPIDLAIKLTYNKTVLKCMFRFNYIMQELVQLVEPRSDLTFHQHQFNSGIPVYGSHTIYKIT